MLLLLLLLVCGLRAGACCRIWKWRRSVSGLRAYAAALPKESMMSLQTNARKKHTRNLSWVLQGMQAY